MAAIVRVRDKDGNITDIPAIVGPAGKSAYRYAVDGGYAGAEKEFAALMAAGNGSSQSVDPDIP